MNCRDAERILLLSWDRPVDSAGQAELDRHLAACPRCRALGGEYAALRDSLHGLPQGTPRPFLWRRVNARLDALEHPAPVAVWRKWCLRAIPVSLFLIGLFIGGLIFLPGGNENLSQSEALLLRDSKNLTETTAFLDEAEGEGRRVMVILTAADRVPERRPQP